jgi:ABC-type branched-subunit amino acid transport system ATPase component
MGQTEQTILEVEGLSKSFGGLMAVSNLDLKVYGGEILGVSGPNGSGKRKGRKVELAFLLMIE